MARREDDLVDAVRLHVVGLAVDALLVLGTDRARRTWGAAHAPRGGRVEAGLLLLPVLFLDRLLCLSLALGVLVDRVLVGLVERPEALLLLAEAEGGVDSWARGSWARGSWARASWSSSPSPASRRS